MKTNIENLIRKNILNLKPYSSARDEYKGDDGIFLDANENPFGIYNRYPNPQQSALKSKLAEIKEVSADNIFLGNGSDEVLDLAFRIFCEPKVDKVLTFTPTYGMYEVAANINDVTLIELPLDENFQIDRFKLAPYFTDESLKMIFICSPNNPTGNVLNMEDIDFILNNFKGIVLIDEAYIDFCPEFSFVNKINEFPNLIVSQTMSKAWGLAGIRLGIGLMNSTLLTYFNKVKAPYNISSVNQQVALYSLAKKEEYLANVQRILVERQNLISKISELSIVEKIYPTHANFILVQVNDANKIYQNLILMKIIIRNRDSVLKNCVRITVGSADENERLLTALKSISND